MIYADYKELHINGVRFDLDGRYGTITAMIFIIMTFSTTMPAMYFLGFLMFIVLYMTDKFMFLRLHQNPGVFTKQVLLDTLSLLEWVMVPHFIFSIAMLA